MKANDLYVRSVTEPAFLSSHELFVNDQWQRFDTSDTFRHPGAPLLLYVEDDYPGGVVSVPMDQMIPIRKIQA